MVFKRNKQNSIFDLKDNNLSICIHKLVGCGDTLYLNCRRFGITDVDLNTEDFETAVSTSRKIIYRLASDCFSAAKQFMDDDTPIEMTRW